MTPTSPPKPPWPRPTRISAADVLDLADHLLCNKGWSNNGRRQEGTRCLLQAIGDAALWLTDENEEASHGLTALAAIAVSKTLNPEQDSFQGYEDITDWNDNTAEDVEDVLAILRQTKHRLAA